MATIPPIIVRELLISKSSCFRVESYLRLYAGKELGPHGLRDVESLRGALILLAETPPSLSLGRSFVFILVTLAVPGPAL